MHKLTTFLPIMLAACASTPAQPPIASVTQELRRAVGSDHLQGRWLIEAVNGRPTTTLWFEFGGEGTVVITQRADGGKTIVSPQPPTKAFLGCNDLQLTGWTRNGDKLALSVEGSRRTERGCDTDTMALEEQAYAILSKSMTMEFEAPYSLRLINESGTLNMIRTGAGR